MMNRQEAKMIDWERLNDLKTEIGEDDFAEVVDMFLEEVEDVLTKLRTEMVLADLEAELHFLKSSALNLGFTDFASLCGRGEGAAAAGQSVDLVPIFDAYLGSKVELASPPDCARSLAPAQPCR